MKVPAGKAEDGTQLAENVRSLVHRLKAGSYRARLVRRRHIPKGKGKTRPLGILVMDDKVVQTGAARLLSAIWEADFLDYSRAYRPRRNAHGAIRALSRGLQFGKFGYVVEADVENYFGKIDHEWLIKMLEQRIDDRTFLRLIRKWLKARILEEDGRITDPATGTPQGGVVSAVLANIYQHYVLDLWFELKVKPNCQGQAMLIRKLRAKYQGAWNYYGLIGNGRSLQSFYHWTLKVLHKWLNRRSQRPGMRWPRLRMLLARYAVPRPHITERPNGATQLEFRWSWC